MAGTIIVSSIKTDTDNSFIVRSNTGATLFSVDTTSISIPDGSITSAMIANGTVIAADVADGSITDAKIAAVANTKITGLITSGQIATVANTQITGLITSGQIATVANTQITGNPLFSAGSNTAPAITTAGDTNTGVFFPAADTIAFAEGGVEAMRIDSAGNVGIGTTSPDNKLEVALTDNQGINLEQLSANQTGYINWRDSDGTLSGRVSYDHGSDAMRFATINTERMRIDSSGNLLFNSGYASVAIAYGCRAWVKFNGTGSIAIAGSGNISSITDNGTGDYTLNFTNSMPDTGYSVVSGNNWSGTGAFITINPNTPIYSTTQVKLAVIDRNGSAQDVSIVTSAIIR